MTQDIITYIILAATACVIAYKLFYTPGKDHHSDCSSGCSGCELKDLKPKNNFKI